MDFIDFFAGNSNLMKARRSDQSERSYLGEKGKRYGANVDLRPAEGRMWWFLRSQLTQKPQVCVFLKGWRTRKSSYDKHYPLRKRRGSWEVNSALLRVSALVSVARGVLDVDESVPFKSNKMDQQNEVIVYDLVDGELVRSFSLDQDFAEASCMEVDDTCSDLIGVFDDAVALLNDNGNSFMLDEQIENEEGELATADQHEELTQGTNPNCKENLGNSAQDEEILLPINCEEDLVVGASGKRKKKLNKANMNKEQKRVGQSYHSRKGVPRSERRMVLEPCSPEKCKLRLKNCGEFSLDVRQTIFSKFWMTADDGPRRDFVLANIVRSECKKRRKLLCDDTSRKSSSVHYYLPLNLRKVRVCRNFFLGTLGVSEKFVRYTEDNQTQIQLGKNDSRGKHPPHNKTPEDQLAQARNFIDLLPAVPSHYCRSSSTRQYLSEDIQNITNLYRLYEAHCGETGVAPITSRVFRRLFHCEYNVGFHKPKKDKCAVCLKNEADDGERSEQYLLHLKEKRDVYHLFQLDQKRATPTAAMPNVDVVCASFDLEKVLNTPRGESMLLYYSRKLAVYNETVYESGTKRGFCFVWNETEGKRGCNEISSVIFEYLNIVENRGSAREVTLYCDSCGGQNRNSTMLFMLLWFMNNSAKNIETLTITFLLPGHSYMPVDSMHSAIDTAMKGKLILAPSQWKGIMEKARVSGDPYVVKSCDYSFFSDWKKMSTMNSGRLKISKLKRASFAKGSTEITLSYSFDQEDTNTTTLAVELHSPVISQKRSTNRKKDQVPQALPSASCQPANKMPARVYKARLPIPSAKYKDLKKLCDQCVIPRKYKQEYISLPHSNKTLDVLNETDEEDGTDCDENVDQ